MEIVILTILFTIVTLYMCILESRTKRTLLFETIRIYAYYIIYLIVQHIFNIRVMSFIVYFVVVSFVLHIIFGQYLDYYNKHRHFDRYYHAFSAFTFSLFVYSILNRFIPSYGKAHNAIFIAAIGISLGCIFEIVEFIQDYIQRNKSKPKHQHGLKDTDCDLAADIIGSIIAGIVSTMIRL